MGDLSSLPDDHEAPSSPSSQIAWSLRCPGCITDTRPQNNASFPQRARLFNPHHVPCAPTRSHAARPLQQVAKSGPSRSRSCAATEAIQPPCGSQPAQAPHCHRHRPALPQCTATCACAHRLGCSIWHLVHLVRGPKPNAFGLPCQIKFRLFQIHFPFGPFGPRTKG